MGKQKTLWRQYLVTICSNLVALNCGILFAYAGPVGLLLLSGEESLELTEAENSWFTSSLTIGAMIGGMCAYFFLQKFGRRGTILLTSIPLFTGWIFLIAAQNLTMLIIGRVSHGIALGVIIASVPPFIGEISHPSIRGRLGTIFNYAVALGNLYIFAFASSIGNFRWISASGVPVAALSTVMTYFFVCESPVYLVDQGKEKEAKEVLKKLNGKKCNVDRLYDSIKIMAEEYKNEDGKVVDWKSFKLKEVYRPLIITLILQFFQQVSGLNAIVFNLYLIFQSSGVALSNDLSSCLFVSMFLLASFINSYTLDRLGRRFMLIISYFGSGVSLGALGAYFYLSKLSEWEEWVQSHLLWLPVVSILGFGLFFNLGGIYIGFLVIGEYFPPNVRMFCSSIISMETWFWGFVISLTYAQTKSGLGDAGVYWMYSCFCFACVLFTAAFVPETKGKTFIEITSYFKTGKFSRRLTEETEKAEPLL